MSRNFASIMAAAWLDQLSIEAAPAKDYPADVFILNGSMQNPLRCLRLKTMDFDSGASFESETLAEVIGVPADWLDADRLAAPLDAVVTALGKLALISLSCQRNEALRYGYQVDAAEEPLRAVETMAEVLEMGRKMAAH